jgi:KUP system potassium uptake protein
MMGSPRGAPIALLYHVKSNRSLQKTVILLRLITDEIPTVAEVDRAKIVELGEGLWRVIGHYGYLESPDATALLLSARDQGELISGLLWSDNW